MTKLQRQPGQVAVGISVVTLPHSGMWWSHIVLFSVTCQAYADSEATRLLQPQVLFGRPSSEHHNSAAFGSFEN